MKIIIGLGNPGEKYINTRHNLGFMVLDEFAKKHLGPELTWQFDKKFKSNLLDVTIEDVPLTLIKPQTFMNNSGIAVKAVVDYFKIALEDLIIIYDELDLPLGKIKVRKGGSAAGHHGVESIMKALNDDKFVRIRLGIGNTKTQLAEHKGEHINVDHYVTQEFKSDEKSKVKHMLKQSLEALDLILGKGLETAQNQFN